VGAIDFRRAASLEPEVTVVTRPFLIPLFTLLCGLGASLCGAGTSTAASAAPIRGVVDLDVGESQIVELEPGKPMTVRLLDLQESRDEVRGAVRSARVRVEVDGRTVTLTSAPYQLPVTVGDQKGKVQIDCPITSGLYRETESDAWGLVKQARLRLWPAGSPWITPGSFQYPARQRWFAGMTQMANEPAYVDGGEAPGPRKVYYHYGLDIGGSEGLVDVVAATNGLVVSSGTEVLPQHQGEPVAARYDVVYLLDSRGWYYRYSHLKRIDVRLGQTVRMGQQIGLLGKEGGSGGWSHLHFEIRALQPSGKWGIEEGYAYLWECYLRERKPRLLAVARPHHLLWAGSRVTLDGSKSWIKSGKKLRYEWTFSDGTKAEGATVERRYETAGSYSEILKVTDDRGRVDYDFAVVQVLDRTKPKSLPPTIHPNYAPTFGLKPGDPVTFKVRTFRTQEGEERWDFGDGTPPVTAKSDGNAVEHAPDGYAVTVHRFAKPGHYLVRVERSNAGAVKAVGRLAVSIGEER
jgi:murein DD-endopeptidase MepM/ murein hydrolase activator NlpD